LDSGALSIINVNDTAMNEKIIPIKRSPALIEFSRDHHYGLLLVWKIRQGLRAGIAPGRISKYVLHYYKEDLLHHFSDEENHLFITLAIDDPMRRRAEKEHNEMQGLLNILKEDPNDITALENLATDLEKHIRFEERELFNRLQSIMTDKELLEVLDELPERPHMDDEEWEDRFWELAKNKV
jgi:hypothetical protein